MPDLAKSGASASADWGETTPPFLLAIVGDLVGSKTMDRQTRRDAQTRLNEALEAINTVLGPNRVARARITVGDEFELLVDHPRSLVPALTWLSRRLMPTRVRLGLGRGAVYTLSDEDRVQEADGPAFHQARVALEHAAQEGQWAAVRGFGDDDRTLTALLVAIGSIQSRWTKRMNEIVLQLREPGSTVPTKSQKQAASELDVSPATVSTALKAADHPVVLRLEQETDHLLTDAWDRWCRFADTITRLEQAFDALKKNHAANLEAEEKLVKALGEVGPPSPGHSGFTAPFATVLAATRTIPSRDVDEALSRIEAMTERLITYTITLLDAPIDKEADLGAKRIRELEQQAAAAASWMQEGSHPVDHGPLIKAIKTGRAPHDDPGRWMDRLQQPSYGHWLVDRADGFAAEVASLAV